MHEIYSAPMVHRLAAASIVSIWLTLFAVDIGDDSGLIKNLGADVDRSVDAALADFGEAIRISDDSETTVSSVLSGHSVAACLTPSQHPGILTIPSVSLYSVRLETGLLKKHSKIHELHQVFLL